MGDVLTVKQLRAQIIRYENDLFELKRTPGKEQDARRCGNYLKLLRLRLQRAETAQGREAVG